MGRVPGTWYRGPVLLPLAELELLAGLRAAGLLALDGTRVARQEAELTKLAAVALVDLHERAGDGEAQRAGLTRLSAALDVGLHVVLAEVVGRGERLLDRAHERGAREVVAEGAAVDVPLARAGLEVQAADGLLAAADGVRRLVSHYLLSLDVKVRTWGCWAVCSCCAPAKTRSLLRSFWRPSAFLGSMPYTAFSMTRSGCLASIVANGVKR